jgi:hypothetical protein
VVGIEHFAKGVNCQLPLSLIQQVAPIQRLDADYFPSNSCSKRAASLNPAAASSCALVRERA